MTSRSELDELHALAASISQETHGWRANRRVRHQAAARARLEAEMGAPIKRKRRHRWIAAAAVSFVAIVAVVLVVTHKPGAPAPAQKRTVATVRQTPVDVRAGQAAAIQLHQLGRTANVFSCQGWYDSQHFALVPAQTTAAWRAGYLHACAEGG